MKNSTHLFASIIAGGAGTRLYPLSHQQCPKQFCDLNERETFIQATVQRFLDQGVPATNIVVVVTSELQKNLAVKQLCDRFQVLEQNVIVIRDDLDFAGAMLAGTQHILGLDPDATVINSPADQHIVANENFKKTISTALQVIDKNHAFQVILGVKVTDLNTVTGCGHARYTKLNKANVGVVDSFVEKPDKTTAQHMLQENNTACNTGITIWHVGAVDTIAKNQGLYNRPLCTDRLMAHLKLQVVVGNFPWYDCGTLAALWDISNKTIHQNAYLGKGKVERNGNRDCLFITPAGCTVYASDLANTAVVINHIGSNIVIAIIRLDYSQAVKQLASKLATDEMVIITGIGGHNNHLSHFRAPDAKVIFAGISDHCVNVVNRNDGTLDVHVSGKSETFA